MITLNASGGSVTFTFSGNSTYLNDGTIEVPVNSLALIIDESDMATFRKAASNDIFVSANIAEFGMTKDELMAWYKANMVGSTGGGGGVTPEEVEEMIDESISGKADSSAVTEEISAAVSGKADSSDVYTTGQTSGATEIANALNAKLDATAYTPVQVSTAITENDTNAVAGGAVYDKVHVTSGNGSTTLLTFATAPQDFWFLATNYPSGVTKFNIEFDLTADWGQSNSTSLYFKDSSNNEYAIEIVNTNGVLSYQDNSSMFGTSLTATTSQTDNVLTIEITGLSGGAPSSLTEFGKTDYTGNILLNAYAVEGEAVEYWIKEYVDAKVAELLALINNL